jgi:glycosyltransferase involved in cell wall biosynthesis
MNEALVSIIIPVYNTEKYLAETIESAKNQTWPNKEIIIVDDGSTDNSLEIAKAYQNAAITIISQTNKGASAARNKGLIHATGKYIQFLDADDLLDPDKIASQMSLLNGKDDYLAICNTIHFKDGDDYKASYFRKEWFSAGTDNPVDFLIKLYAGEEVLPGYGGMVTIHSWLTPRILIDKAGLWNEKLSVDDDGEFFCRTILASSGILFSDGGPCYYRKFNYIRSLSSQKNLKALVSEITAIDLKYSYLKAKRSDKLIDRIFARHYWWTGVLAYPQFRTLSKRCIQKAKELNYTGQKYVGGPTGHAIANFLGWRMARILFHYKQQLKNSWPL